MTRTWFSQWRAAGYAELLSVMPPDARTLKQYEKDRGKIPGVRLSDGLWVPMKNWALTTADDAMLATWESWGGNMGLRLGSCFLLDLDIYDPPLAQEIEDRAIQMFGPAPLRVGEWPKRALLYRADGLIHSQRLHFDGKDGVTYHIEVNTHTVVEGVHPRTGKPYDWPRGRSKFADLTVVAPEKLQAFFDAMEARLPGASREKGATSEGRPPAALRGHSKVVEDIMRRMRNTKEAFPTYGSMVATGYALRAALPHRPELARELWHVFASDWEGGDYDFDLSERRFESFKDGRRVGADRLYELGDKYAPRADGIEHKAAALFLEPPETDEADPTATPAPDYSTIFPETPAAPPPRKLSLISLQDAAASALTAATKPLVKGLLDQGTLSVMYGPSNVGKTFAAMDIFFHISTGLPWGGMRTERGLVVYVAAEGGAGARKRADALCKRYGAESASADFQMLLSPVDLLRPDADLLPLIDAIKGLGRPVLGVAMDTLSRIMAGGEENSSVDMGTLVKHIDRIRKETGAHVMLVHHSGKDQARGARGHSLLRAATDTEIEVAEGQIAVTKQRDLEKSYSTAFRLNVVQLGVDADGEPVTSCTVDLVRRIDEPLSPLTPKEEIVIEALNVLLSTSDAKRVRTADIAAYLTEAKQDDMSPDTVRAHLKNMAKKRAVTVPIRGYWSTFLEEISLPDYKLTPLEDDEVEESGRRKGNSVFE